MDWSLPFWLTVGFLLGWLLEFLIDYFFWRKKCEASTASLQSELNTLQSSVKGIEAELTNARSVRASLESSVGNLQSKYDGVLGRIGLLVGTGGALGAIGRWLGKGGDDQEFKAQIADVNASLKAKSELEAQVGHLDAKLSSVNIDSAANLDKELSNLRSRFDLERKAKADLESRLGKLQDEIKANADVHLELSKLRSQFEAERYTKAELKSRGQAADTSSSRAVNRLELLAGAGGLVAELGAAFNADDGRELESCLDELTGQLKAKAGLEAELGELRGQLEAERNAKAEFEARINALQLKADVSNAPEAELGELRSQLEAERNAKAEFEARIGSLEGSLQAMRDLESQLGDMPKFSWIDAKDELKLINGIGPVLENRLHEAGITTYKQVAEADPDQLYSIVEAKAWQKVDTRNWIRQAKDLKSSGKVMILKDGSLVGKEGDELRNSLNIALSKIARLEAEVAANPKAPRSRKQTKVE